MAERIAPKLLKVARAMGARDVRLEWGGKHPRLIGQIQERRFMYVFSNAASDWRAGRNALAGLRRLLDGKRPEGAAQ